MSLFSSDVIGGLLVVVCLLWALSQSDDRRGGGTMIAWLLSLAIALAPPGRVPARESEEAALVRYESIAEDLEAVASEQATLFPGADGRALTASLLLLIAVHESGLRLDVDQGLTRGEGRDVCLLQIRTWREDIATDRRACFREGLRLARASFAATRDLDPRDRLRVYASGTRIGGSTESHAMIDSWRRALAVHPPPSAAAPSIAFALAVHATHVTGDSK